MPALLDVPAKNQTRAKDSARNADKQRRLADLVRRAQRGSRRAFAALWQGNAGMVQRILETMLRPEAAEDLAQDVAIAAFCRLSDLQDAQRFAAWLSAIARNAGRDALGAIRKHPETLLGDAELDVAAPPARDESLCSDVLAAIDALPACHREPLRLRLLYEMNGPEIAARVGMTEGSVRVNLCKGMKLLRARLAHWA